jgi:GH24 family phage-related lysozyme (muramidase)
MRTSDEGLRMIEEFEGFRAELYNDAAGDCTVGYGTLVHLRPCCGDPRELIYAGGITHEEAEQLLRERLVEAEAAIERLVTVALNQAQFDALVSFTYNLGVGTLSRSTLLRRLNAGEYAAVPEELERFVNAGGRPQPGLVARRRREAELWRSAPAPGGIAPVPALSVAAG